MKTQGFDVLSLAFGQVTTSQRFLADPISPSAGSTPVGRSPAPLRPRCPSRSAVPGALPAACWDGVVRRSTAWARRAGPARSPVTVCDKCVSR